MSWETELQQVRTLSQRVARSYGLELFDVQLRRESIGLVLRVFIDRPAPPDGRPEPEGLGDGVGVDDCQRVSQDLSVLLDVEDVLDHAYTLEVSSPGLDRPLRDAGDYRRFAGRLAKIVLTDAVDGQQHFKGRLRGLEQDAVLLEDAQGRIHRLPLGAVARGKLEVEF